MTGETDLAAKLFPAASAEAQAKTEQPAQTQEQQQASRLFPKTEQQLAAKNPSLLARVAAEQQQKPAEAKSAEQQQQQKPAEAKANPEAIAKAATEVATTLAEKSGLDPAHADTISFSKLAAEAGISSENAAKLAAWDASRAEAQREAQFTAWNEATNAEFLVSDLEAARSVVMEHGDAELQELLTYGLGSHPALVRFCLNVARSRRGR